MIFYNKNNINPDKLGFYQNQLQGHYLWFIDINGHNFGQMLQLCNLAK